MTSNSRHTTHPGSQQETVFAELRLLRQRIQQNGNEIEPLCFDVRDLGLSQRQLECLIAGELLKPLPLRGSAEVDRTNRRFAITEVGIEFIEEVLKILLGPRRGFKSDPARRDNLRPRWDPVQRELRFGSVLIKRFRKSAPNQERVLAAFEESGWPRRIDDPLPSRPGLASAVRLHDTINSLNRSMRKPILRFGSDGTGNGIYWRNCPDEEGSEKNRKISQSPPITTGRQRPV